MFFYYYVLIMFLILSYYVRFILAFIVFGSRNQPNHPWLATESARLTAQMTLYRPKPNLHIPCPKPTISQTHLPIIHT